MADVAATTRREQDPSHIPSEEGAVIPPATLTQYEQFIAEFRPARADDLRPGAEDWVGYVGEWQALWIISEEDGGQFVGEWYCAILDSNVHPPFAWVPSCDLTRVEDAP